MPKINYEREFAKALRENTREVLDMVKKKDSGLMIKVEHWAKKYGFKKSEVLKHIISDRMFAAGFSKDPAKQKIHENTAAKFIKKLAGVKGFKQLGHGALAISQGAVITPKELKSRGGTSRAKTIDFKWQTGGATIYASQKFTKDSGGAQDNQYKDLQEFIRQANDSGLKNTYFLAIADGSYYQLKNKEGETKLSHLEGLANRNNVFAITTDTLQAWLDSLKT